MFNSNKCLFLYHLLRLSKTELPLHSYNKLNYLLLLPNATGLSATKKKKKPLNLLCWCLCYVFVYLCTRVWRPVVSQVIQWDQVFKIIVCMCVCVHVHVSMSGLWGSNFTDKAISLACVDIFVWLMYKLFLVQSFLGFWVNVIY